MRPRHPRPTVAIIVIATLALAATLLVPASRQAEAQAYDPPSQRFAVNARGDIDFIGNTLLTCPTAAGGCTAAQTTGNNAANNQYAMVYVDQDTDPTTFNSSASTLTLPPGANVLFAGLYWGARSTDAARNQALFKTPGGTYQPVTAAVVDSDGGQNYQSFYDATAEVQAAGNGQYTLANVQAQTGSGRHAGWSMLVVYEDPSLPFRNLVVYDGFARINPANPVTITVSGFTTPVVGPVTAKVTQVVYEGDERYTGDQMRFEGTVLGDGAHPANNFFNSRISKDGVLFNDKDPNYVDQLGFEVARTDVSGLLGNGQTSATIDYTSAGDWYFVGAVATAIDIFVPDLDTDFDKSATDLNGGDVVVGDIIEYTMTGSNLGLDPAINSFLFDAIPAGTTYVPGTLEIVSHPDPALDATTPDDAIGNIATDGGGYDAGLGEVQFDLRTIGVGESFEVSFQVEIGPGTEFTTVTNTANIDYDSATTEDPFSTDASASVDVVASADLELIAKTDNLDPVIAGQQVQYTVDVINNGPSPAVNAVVVDTLPAGLSFVSGPGCTAAGQVVTCALTTPLAAGAPASVTITALVDPDTAATTVKNGATVSSDTPDPDATNNNGSETTEIVRRTDVEIAKSGPAGPINAGEAINYTVTVSNDGPSTSQSTIVTDVLPPGTTLVSAVPSNGASCGGTTLITCNLGTLAPGQSVDIAITVETDDDLVDPTTLTNAASVTTTTPETDTTNNEASVDTVVERLAELVIDKSGPATVDAGEIISFTVTVSNNGPSIATAPIITDTLPAPLIFDAATSSPACTLTAPPQGVTCALGDMVPGPSGEVSVTVSALVPSSATPQSLVNTASVAAVEDPDGANDTHPFDITREVSLTIAKSDDIEPIAAGETLTYTVRAGNDGPSDASAVSIVDSLPPEVSFSSATFVPATAGTCTHDLSPLGGDVTCTPNAGVIASGDSYTITIVVDVPANLAAGVTLTNDVTVTAAEDPVGASATETTNTVNEVNLSIGKTVSPNPVLAGEAVTYVVTFLNEGPSNATNAQIVDSLPTNVTFSSATPSTGSCSHDGVSPGGDVTCTFGTINAGDQVTVTIVATVDPSTADDTNATNTVTGTADGATPVDGSAVVNVQRAADMAITKTASPDPVVAGQQLTYTIRVDNLGPSDSSGVAALDPLPAGLSIVTLPAQCSDSGGTVGCSLGVIPAGTGVTLNLVVEVDASVQPGTDLLPNTATVSADEPDPDPSNNESLVDVDVTADVGLTLTKADNVDPVVAGERVIYTLVAGNSGPSDADNVTISDTPPPGMTFDAANSSANCLPNAVTIDCALGTIAPGDTASVNIAFIVDAAAAPGTVTNNATVTSDEDNVGADASEDTTIERRADLAIVKTATPEPVVPGTPITYQLVVTNNGPSVAVNTTIADTLASTLAFDTVTPAPACGHDGAATGGLVNCSLGDLDPDEQITITITADVDDAATSAIANTATVDSDTTDPNPDNDTSSTSTPVTPLADVSITKSDSADPVIAGTAISWTLEWENDGPSAAAGVVVSDTLPPQVSFVSAPGCTHDGSSVGGVVTCTLGNLASGDDGTITINATVDPATTSVLMVNEASIATTTTETDPSNNDASESTAIVAEADLALTKTAAPDPVIAGQQVTYVLTVQNLGPSAAQAVNMADTMPAGVQFDSVTVTAGPATCTHDGAANGGTLGCGYGTLAVGETRIVEVVANVLPSATGTLTNTATATSPTDDTPPVAGASVTVNTSADLVMTEKTHDVNPAIAGQGLTWTIAVRNDGPSDAVNAVITDVLPAGVTFDIAGSTAGCVDAGGTVTCPVGTLAPGATASIELAVDIDAAELGPIDNTASTGSDTPDPDPSNNEQSELTTIEQQSQVTLVKTSSPDPVVAGEPLTYTIIAENLGPSVAAGATLNDPMPLGATATATATTQGSCTTAPALVTCAFGDLLVGQPVTVTIDVDTDPALLDGAALLNTATVDWTGNPDPVNAPNSTDVVREADIGVTKVDRENEVPAGTDIVWDLEVTNAGPSDATNVVVTDTLPPNTAFNSAASSPTCSAIGLTVTCIVPAVAVGVPVPLVIAATVESLVPAGTVVTNEVTVSGDEPDDNPDNDTDTEQTVITQVNDLAIEKADEPDPAIAGEEITWTVTVSNNGPSNATNITIQDQLPASVTFSGGEVTCFDLPAGTPGAVVTCSIPGIAAGDSVDLLIVGDVDPNLIDGSAFDNTVAIATYDGTDPNLDNNSDLEPTTIDRNAGLMLTKDASPETVVAGEQITWTLTLTNEGPSAASGVQLVDDLPAGITVDSITVTTGVADCSLVAGDVVCDVGTAPSRTLVVDGTVIVEIVATTDSTLADGASIPNSAAATSPDNDGPAEATAQTPVTRSADLSVTKQASPDPVIAGETIDYVIAVNNAGPSVATNVVVADALPLGVTWTSGDCTPIGASVECTTATIPADGSAVFSFTATVDPSVADGTQLLNTAVASATETDPNEDNNDGSVTTDVEREADLSITKSDGDVTVIAGETVTYSITVANAGPSQASGVIVTDPVPANTSFDQAGSTPGCTETAGVVSCPVMGPIDPDDDRSIVIAFLVDDDVPPGSTLTNTATVAGNETDPDPDNDDSTDTTPTATSADVSIVKNAVETMAVAGSTLNWTLDVTNAGPSQAANVIVTDTLPAGLSVVAVSPAECNTSVSCTFPTVDVGDTITVNIESLVDSNQTEPLINDASVTTDTPDPDPDDNTSPEVEVPVGIVADLVVDKSSAPDPVVPGSPIVYTIIVTNNGPSDVVGATLTDTTPDAVVEPTATCVVDAADGTCTETTIFPETSFLLDLVAGASATIEITGTVDPAITDGFINTAEVTPPVGVTDPNPDNNVDDDGEPGTPTVVTDLAVTKASTPNPATAGEPISYEIIITNNGPSRAVGASVVDTLPSAIVAPTASCAVDPDDGTCSVGLIGSLLEGVYSLDPGTSLTITVNGTVDVGATGALTNTVAVAPGPGAADPDTSDNQATDINQLDTKADLTITKVADSDSVVAGETITWTVTVTNAGPSTAASVVATDTLPAGLTIVDEPDVCTAGVCTLGSIPPGQPVELTFETLVDSDVTGTVTNAVGVTSTTPDPNPDDNSDSDEATVQHFTDLSIAKSSAPDPLVAGEAITYTLVVTNNGPSDATGATLSDAVPAAVLGAVATCTATDPGSSCTITSSDPANATLDLPAGESATIEVTGTVDPAVTGSITNTATVDPGPTDTDPDPSNNGSTNVNPSIGEADLSITKVADPDPVVAGETITWTLVVTNDGPSQVVGATVRDVLPSEVTSAVATCSVTAPDACSPSIAAGEMNASLTLAPGASATITIVADIDSAATGSVTNTATVTPPPGITDPDPDDNTSTTDTPIATAADLALTKTANAASVVAGTSMTWTVLVTNNGPSTAVDVEVTDALPPGLTIVAEPAGCTGGVCNIGALGPDSVVELVFTTDVDAGVTEPLVNAAAVVSTTPDPDTTNNADATEAVPVEIETDLSITKTSTPDPAVNGEAITYTLVVTNNGPSDAIGATVTDPVPAAVLNATTVCANVAAAAGCTVTSNDPAAASVDLPVGVSVSIEVTGTLDPAFDGTLANTATVSPGPGATDPRPFDNEATNQNPSTGEADLSITKTATPATFVAGERVMWELVVTNAGPSAVLGARVQDLLPAVISDVTVNCATTGADTCLAALISGNLEGSVDLAPGASATFTIDGLLDPAVTGTIDNAATVYEPVGITDPDPTNNESMTTSPVEASADLSVAKRPSATSVIAGDSVTWIVEVTNAGPSTATSVVVDDVLPAGLTIIGEPTSCDNGTCTLAAIEPGRTTTLFFTTEVDPAVTGDITNTVTVTSPVTDPNPDDNTTTSMLGTDIVTDLAITKTSTPDPKISGNPITYTLVVTNNGPSDAVGATIVDGLPDAILSPAANCVGVVAIVSCAINATDPLDVTLDVPAGLSATIEITGTVDPSYDGALTNVATIAAGPGSIDPSPTNNTATDVNPSLGRTDLAVTKTAAPSAAVPGEAITYTIVVANAGPSVAAGATLIDLLSVDLLDPVVSCTVTDGACSTTLTGQELTASLDLGVGSLATIVVDATIDPDASGSLANTATVVPPTGFDDPDPSDNTSTTNAPLAPEADLSVTKIALDDSVVAGDTMTWQIAVTNDGPSAATEVVINDVLPAGLTVVGAPANCMGSQCDFGTVAAGATVTVELETSVDPAAASPLVNQVSVSSATTDPDGSNNMVSSAGVAITPATDLRITKSTSPSPVTAGEAVTWTIVVGNAGPSAAIGATVTDTLPSGVIDATARCDAPDAGAVCTVSLVDGTVDATLDLPATASATITIDGTVDPDARGSLTNSAEVVTPAGATDRDPDDNISLDVVSIVVPDPAPTPTPTPTPTPAPVVVPPAAAPGFTSPTITNAPPTVEGPPNPQPATPANPLALTGNEMNAAVAVAAALFLAGGVLVIGQRRRRD